MVAALKSGESQLRGIALIDDSTTDRQLEKLHKAGVMGIRLHLMPDTAQQVLASLPNLAARIQAFGWHIQLYVDVTLHSDLAQHLTKLPVPVVIDHFGLVSAATGIQSDGFKSLLQCIHSGHCWVKLSAPCRISSQAPRFPDVTPLVRILIETAPDFCLWGTDWPHPNTSYVSNDGDLVDLLPEWIPDEALRQKVLVENPARLYSF
jgi:predicted TIM-barrel fold metal-dependent hydrolase